MSNQKEYFFYYVQFFSLCFIGCINKKTQTAELEKVEVNNTQVKEG